MIKQPFFSGWDIGGAHLKVARCDYHGKLLNVIQLPCPLWKGIEHLNSAIHLAHQSLNNKNDITAITMTGELADIFPSRQKGVAGIIHCLKDVIPTHQTHIFSGATGWLTPEDSVQQWQSVASRNWQASANFVAQSVESGLFIDIGSTTCDIIPIDKHKAVPQGYDDHQRQLSRELLYTGVIRTPLIALANTAPFAGNLISLAAEVFATTGDCWCLLDQLDPKSIQDISADGQSWQKPECAQRLARLLGCDAIKTDSKQWQQLAQWFAQQQVHQISNACLQVLSNHLKIKSDAPIIGAGIGRFIAKMCAVQLNRPYIDFSTLTTPSLSAAADHAPAVAVALLAQQQLA
ncbi:MAG: H4MPT-linked C1 transfer pathway protein [Methylophaga sp.]|nr:MAG: H4MPT-linked C1 transfer pathway protein [Methylophaga sp.]